MNEEVKKKGLSTGAKWGIGCGCGCLVMVVLIVIGVFFGVRYAKNKVTAMSQELRQYGFEKEVKGQVVEVRDEITEPTLYTAQIVKILGNCTTNIAILAQMAEIHGKVEGKVYFRGQILTIQPNAEIMNGLDVMAQVIQKYGTVNGEITGSYQSIVDKTAKQ
jgi:hypothetical protein